MVQAQIKTGRGQLVGITIKSEDGDREVLVSGGGARDLGGVDRASGGGHRVEEGGQGTMWATGQAIVKTGITERYREN